MGRKTWTKTQTPWAKTLRKARWKKTWRTRCTSLYEPCKASFVCKETRRHGSEPGGFEAFNEATRSTHYCFAFQMESFASCSLFCAFVFHTFMSRHELSCLQHASCPATE